MKGEKRDEDEKDDDAGCSNPITTAAAVTEDDAPEVSGRLKTPISQRRRSCFQKLF